MALRQLDPKYKSVIEKLAATLRGEADAVLKGNHALEVTEHFGIKISGFVEAHKGFSRQGLEKEYQSAHDKKELDVLTSTALVLQNDALAGVEKAYQLRHRRRLDYLVSGTSRANGMASPKGFVAYAMTTLPLTGEPRA